MKVDQCLPIKRIAFINEHVCISYQARTNMARCKPLANIYDGAVNTFLCDNIVQNAVRDVFNFRRCYYQSGISAGFVIVIFFYFILETKIKAATS